MPKPLRFPSEIYRLPRYYQRVVIPQASVRTLYSVPFNLLPTNPDEFPFVEHFTVEKLNGIAYTGTTSQYLVLDLIGALAGSTAALTLNEELVLGITSGKSVFRNYGGNDYGEYANGSYGFGRYYNLRLSAPGGSDYSAGTGDVIVELFYTSVLRNNRI